MKIKVISTIMLTLFLASMLSIAVPVMADTGRFTGLTYVYRVETQAEVDALPEVIDATAHDIGILVEGSGLIIDGFTITGSTTSNDYCIAVDGQTGVTVSNCELTGGYVALYYYASSGAIISNTVSGYTKNGITANLPSGDGGCVEIKWNTVTGNEYDEVYAQNGIQIGWGATGDVLFNTVRNHWYTGADWASSGILIFESDDCMVKGNELEHNQVGVAIETWAWLGEVSASGNRIVKNTINDGQVGVSIAAYAWVYTDSGDPTANNNKVSQNTIEDQDYGIIVQKEDTSIPYDVYADNNKAIRNSFSGITEDEIVDDGTATKVQANVIGV